MAVTRLLRLLLCTVLWGAAQPLEGSQPAYLKITSDGSMQPSASLVLGSTLVVGGVFSGTIVFNLADGSSASAGVTGLIDSIVFGVVGSPMAVAWRLQIGGTGSTSLQSMSSDGRGNVYVSGWGSDLFAVTTNVGPVSLPKGAFLLRVRFTDTSASFTGAWSLPGTGVTAPGLFAYTGSDLVYMSGSFLTVYPTPSTPVLSTGGTVYANAYVASLNTTSATWSIIGNVTAGSWDNSVSALALSPDGGTLYACGGVSTVGAAAVFQPLVTPLTYGEQDVFVAALALKGPRARLWTSLTVGGTPSTDFCTGLIASDDGGVYALVSTGTGAFFVNSTQVFMSEDAGVALLGFRANTSAVTTLNLTWALGGGSILADDAFGLALDAVERHVFFTGSCENACQFGNITVDNANGQQLPYLAVAQVSPFAASWYKAFGLRDAVGSASAASTLALNMTSSSPATSFVCGTVSSGSLYFGPTGTSGVSYTGSGAPGFCSSFSVDLVQAPSASATATATTTVNFLRTATVASTGNAVQTPTRSFAVAATGTSMPKATASSAGASTSPVKVISQSAPAPSPSMGPTSAASVTVVATGTSMPKATASSAGSSTRLVASVTQAAPTSTPATSPSSSPGQVYRVVSVGGFHGLAMWGLPTGGGVAFFGLDTQNVVAANAWAASISGLVTGVAAGGFHSCVLARLSATSTQQVVRCWGTGPAVKYPDSLLNTSTTTSVACGGYFCCALNNTGGVACWGNNRADVSNPPPAVAGGSYSLGLGAYHGCAVLKTDSGAGRAGVACWGRDAEGQVSGMPPFLASTSAALRSVTCGGYHCCSWGLDPASVPYSVCWGGSPGALTQPPGLGVVQAMCAGGAFTCAIHGSAFKVTCWGSNNYGETMVHPTAAAGPVSAVSCGWYGACALLPSGQFVCWGGPFGTVTNNSSAEPVRAVVVSSERNRNGNFVQGPLAVRTGASADASGGLEVGTGPAMLGVQPSGDLTVEARGGSGVAIGTGASAGGNSGGIILSTGSAVGIQGAISIASTSLCIGGVCMTPQELSTALKAARPSPIPRGAPTVP